MILVTGASGLVGSRFCELYTNKNYLLTPNENEFNFMDLAGMNKFLAGKDISSVVHFAAYTNVNAAENERGNKDGLCWKVNVSGLNNLLSLFDLNKIKFVNISTDYVFSGSESDPGPYEEDHKIESNLKNLTWYGYSKAEAERIVTDTFGNKKIILRINYPVRSEYNLKLDFIRKPLKLFDEGKLYPMFTDQKLSISFVDEICAVLEKLLENDYYGIFHSSSCDTTNPYELVSYLLEKYKGVKNVVNKSSLDEFVKSSNIEPFRYPKHGGLIVEKTEKKLGLKFRSWKQIVDQLISDGIKY